MFRQGQRTRDEGVDEKRSATVACKVCIACTLKRRTRENYSADGSNRLDSRGALMTPHLGLETGKLSDVSASSPISEHQRWSVSAQKT